MRRAPFALATLLVASMTASAANAEAQGSAIDKCTGLFEEAQLKEKRGRLVEAQELYAACADSQCPSMIRSDCAPKRDEIQRRLPTATVVVRDAAGNDVKASVDIDGKPLSDRTHAQPIDPGDHLVTYRIEGKAPATHKFTAVEGEKARVINITATDVPGTKPDAPRAPTDSSAGTQQGPAIVGPVILGGVGVILLATAVGFHLSAQSEHDDASDLTAKANAPTASAAERQEFLAAADSHYDAGDSAQILAVVTGISGLACIGAGATWYLLTRSSSAPKKASLAPTVAPGFAGGTFALAF